MWGSSWPLQWASPSPQTRRKREYLRGRRISGSQSDAVHLEAIVLLLESLLVWTPPKRPVWSSLLNLNIVLNFPRIISQFLLFPQLKANSSRSSLVWLSHLYRDLFALSLALLPQDTLCGQVSLCVQVNNILTSCLLSLFPFRRKEPGSEKLLWSVCAQPQPACAFSWVSEHLSQRQRVRQRHACMWWQVVLVAAPKTIPTLLEAECFKPKRGWAFFCSPSQASSRLRSKPRAPPWWKKPVWDVL